MKKKIFKSFRYSKQSGRRRVSDRKYPVLFKTFVIIPCPRSRKRSKCRRAAIKIKLTILYITSMESIL